MSPICLTVIIQYVRRRLEALRLGQIDPQMLLVSQTLSRSLEEYRVLSPAARAVKQLQAVNKLRFPGQRIRFVFTVDNPGVFAWDLPKTLDPSRIDVERYIDLTLRAVAAVLQPWASKENGWMSGFYMTGFKPVSIWREHENGRFSMWETAVNTAGGSRDHGLVLPLGVVHTATDAVDFAVFRLTALALLGTGTG